MSIPAVFKYRYNCDDVYRHHPAWRFNSELAPFRSDQKGAAQTLSIPTSSFSGAAASLRRGAADWYTESEQRYLAQNARSRYRTFERRRPRRPRLAGVCGFLDLAAAGAGCNESKPAGARPELVSGGLPQHPARIFCFSSIPLGQFPKTQRRAFVHYNYAGRVSLHAQSSSPSATNPPKSLALTPVFTES